MSSLKSLVVVLLQFNYGWSFVSKSPKIVIVGAGLAGVSAAVKLMENGFEDVTILEAEDRVGGRIYSVPFANGLIDMGAQWVHGETNNVVFDLINGGFDFGDTGIDLTPSIFQNSDGTPADQKQCARLNKLSEEILVDYKGQSRFKGSLGDFFTQEYRKDLKAAKYNDISLDLSNQILDFYEKEINIWNGSHTWFDISAWGNTISGVNDGNQYLTWRDKGYITVFDFLTKKRPNPSMEVDIQSKLKLNTKVSNINVVSKLGPQQVEVTCEDGSKYQADHVIFTGSLGVLKRHHQTLFTPPLPKRKVKAIEAMGYGTLGKIFLEFEQPFWSTNVKEWVSYSLLWNQTDIKSLKGTDREWLIDIRSFTRVDDMPNLIEALIAGKKMTEFENLDDEKVKTDCMWLLEKFLNKKLPVPKAIKKTKWLTKENFFGTYSYQSLEAGKNRIGPRHLAKSITNLKGKPVILFAGEATDDKFPSNAHGAVSSGWRAAREIGKSYYKKFIY